MTCPLPILRPDPRQDCITCACQAQCYRSPKPEHITVNLLVCRIKRNVDPNRSARQLLSLLRPKLQILAARAVRGTHLDRATALQDLETETISTIIARYVLGDVSPILVYLFSKNGHLTRYAQHYRHLGEGSGRRI